MAEEGTQPQEWRTADPLTLVTEARNVIQGQPPQAIGPIEEIISRFEQLTVATMGQSNVLQNALLAGVPST